MARFLLIILVLYFVFRLMRRSIMIYTVNSFQNKMQEQMRKQQQQEKQQKRQNEGKIKVDFIPPDKNKRFGDKDGDYVDYEEIK